MAPELFTVEPGQLTFPFDPKRQVSSSLQVINITDNYVAFKVKTTSPKKYSVKPNTGIILPHSSANIIIIMQAQRENPLDLQCRDRFLIQGVIASPDMTTLKDIPQDWFNVDSVKEMQERKLRVVYLPPPQPPSPVLEAEEEKEEEEGPSPMISTMTGNADQSVFACEPISKESELKAKIIEARANMQIIEEEYHSILVQNQRLEEELKEAKDGGKAKMDVWKPQPGFSFLFLLLFGLFGVLMGYLFSP